MKVLPQFIQTLIYDPKTEKYSMIHVFACSLAALHVFALALWLFLTVRQKPPSIRDRVGVDKEE
jgi:hypothetical protein